MDENELLKAIYTRIGMLMEDSSIIALTLGGPKSAMEEQGRGELDSAVHAIAALHEAAQALQR